MSLLNVEGRMGILRKQSRSGFTLIEMLVVVGILAVLVGILVPVIIRAQKKANETRMAADLQAIGVGLEAYKQDYASYPLTNRAVSGTGSQILAMTMIAPGPAIMNTSVIPPFSKGTLVTVAGIHFMAQDTTTVAPSASAAEWRIVPIPYWDGAGLGTGVDGNKPGPGFRIRPVSEGTDGVLGTADDGYNGKVLGPYLDVSRFQVGLKMQMLDGKGNPILYFPAKLGRGNVLPADPAVIQQDIKPDFPKSDVVTKIRPRPTYVDYSAAAYFDLRDNFGSGMTQSITDLTPTVQWPKMYLRQSPSDPLYLGGTGGAPLAAANVAFDKIRLNVQNRLEKAGDFAGGYILWSAGPDEFFFTEDDVTNFGSR